MQEEISKTQRKKEMTELQKLGEALVGLSESELREFSIEDGLRDAVLAAKRMTSHEAKRRQMQYIGRLMRDTDPAPIRAQVEALHQGSAASAAAHKRLEAWRERLLADDAALTEFALVFPHTNLQQLRVLIRNAKKERETAKPPRSYRELFRFIKACSDSNPS